MTPTPADARPTLADVRAAADRIRGHVVRTPALSWPALDRACGAAVLGKCETFQPTGSFKDRGACNAVFSLPDADAARGVVTHSSGNHAAALARAAGLRGVPAYVVMPSNARPHKLAAVRRLGVEPVISGPTTEERAAAAEEVRRRTGAVPVPPFDDARVIAGQGTLTLELLEDAGPLDALVVPVGGGGMLSGVLIAAKALRPGLEVVAAEPELADDAYRSWKSGRREPARPPVTVADGLRTGLGDLTYPIIRDLVDGVVLASEAAIVEATRLMLEQIKVVVEPSGAVGVAAIRQNPDRFRGKRVAVVLCGGNLDLDNPPWAA